jgi:hypothetical protein
MVSRAVGSIGISEMSSAGGMRGSWPSTAKEEDEGHVSRLLGRIELGAKGRDWEPTVERWAHFKIMKKCLEMYRMAW